MARSCRLTAERMARHLRGERPQGNRLEGLASVGDLAKSKTKERQGRAPRVHCLLIVFDKVGKPTGTEPSEGRGQAGGTTGKTRTIWYNGDIKKNPRQRVRPECSKHISIISDRRLLTSGTDELNDKQGKKIKKKSQNGCVLNNLGIQANVRSPV